jgi:hypothetical protein
VWYCAASRWFMASADRGSHCSVYSDPIADQRASSRAEVRHTAVGGRGLAEAGTSWAAETRLTPSRHCPPISFTRARGAPAKL